jgi:molybdate transport system substrate-binding protein
MQLCAAAIALAALILPTGVSADNEVVVAAAASLREPILGLARDFESQHPEVRVRVSFGASSNLARQIRLGAPIDVFVAADRRWAVELLDGGFIAPGDDFALASNRLVVVARPGLGLRVSSAEDLLNPLLERFALPSPAVPLGAYSRQWLESTSILAALEPRLITTEHARASLAAVEQQHVDAALVYASDAQQARKSAILYRIPDSEQPEIIYSAALLRRSNASPNARAFYRMLGSTQAGQRLASAGFVTLENQVREPSP